MSTHIYIYIYIYIYTMHVMDLLLSFPGAYSPEDP